MRCARPWARELAARGAGRCRRDRAGAGFRRAGGARLFAGIGHPVRSRHHPQPLCRPHLHRADPADPPARRAAEAQCQPRGGRRQAHRAGRRFDRARHHLDQDRADDARCRRQAKCISASPRRRSRIRIITASTRRTATSCWPPPIRSKRCAPSSARIRSPSCRSTASTARWASRSAIRCARNSPIIASPANIRPRSPTRARSAYAAAIVAARRSELKPPPHALSSRRHFRETDVAVLQAQIRRIGFGSLTTIGKERRAPDQPFPGDARHVDRSVRAACAAMSRAPIRNGATAISQSPRSPCSWARTPMSRRPGIRPRANTARRCRPGITSPSARAAGSRSMTIATRSTPMSRN